MEEEKYPDPQTGLHAPERVGGAGAFLEGREMFTPTEESGSPACHCPRGATQSSHVWKGQIATASRLLQAPLQWQLSPDVMAYFRAQGLEPS